MKAIKITKDNKERLASQYEIDPEDLKFASGLYLVAGFGDKQYEGLLTPAKLVEKFHLTGTKLNNDFFEVAKREN